MGSIQRLKFAIGNVAVTESNPNHNREGFAVSNTIFTHVNLQLPCFYEVDLRVSFEAADHFVGAAVGGKGGNGHHASL